MTTKDKTRHTPLPWVYSTDKKDTIQICSKAEGFNVICDTISEGHPESFEQDLVNVQFIVKACNNHTALVEALKYPRYGDTATLLEKVADNLEHLAGPGHTSIFTNHLLNAAKQMRAALKAVEGE